MDPRIAELVIRLQENPFFRPLDVGIVKQIAQSVQEVIFGVGDQIIKPEDVANDFFIISQGHAKKEQSQVFGADAATGVLKSGEFFGHFSLIYQVPHGLSIIAMETLYLFKIPKDKFVQLYNQHPDFAAVFNTRVIRDGDFADHIRPLSFFNILNIEQLSQILPQVDVELYTDEALLQERYQAGDLLVINSGELQVTCEGNGILQNITMTRGNYLTLLSEPREVSFKIITPLVCYMVSQAVLDETLLNDDHGAVLKSFLDRSLIMSHLEKTSLFNGITGNDLALLAWMVAQVVFEANRYIYRQGDVGLRYYMVYQGKVEVRALNKDGKRPAGNSERYEISSAETPAEGYKLLPQYSYGENELYFGLPTGKGLWAMGRTELFFINQSAFTYIRKNNPDLVAYLNPDASITQKLQFANFKFDDKRDDEEVIYACHRHWVSFALSLITPPAPGLVRVPVVKSIWPSRETFILIFMGMVALLWLSWSYLMQWGNRFYQTSLLVLAPSPITLSVLVVLTVIFILWVLWNFVDWQNDYLVITTKRVVRREKLVLLHEDQAQSELSKVEKVVTKSGFMGNMFGYCDLTIQTAAADGTILLDKAPQTSQLYSWLRTLPFVGRFVPPPNKIFAHNVIETILKEQAERRQFSAIENSAGGLQGVLRRQMTSGSKKDAWLAAPVDSPPPPRLSRWAIFRQNFSNTSKAFWDSALPWRLHGVPKDAKKIWHKHWLNLLWQVMDSMLSFIAVTIFVVIYFAGLHVYLRFVPSLASLNDIMPYLDFLVIAVYVIISLRFWWELADWSNDLYILTDKQLIDVEKKPLYFAERRDQVELTKIQSISFTQAGLVDTLFKIGDVKIEMAGGTPVIFRRVPNPRDVQNEIFKQMDDVKSKARQKEVEDEVKKMTQWFDAYHNTFIRVN